MTDEQPGDPSPHPPPKRISPLMRLLVVIFGVSLLGLGRTLVDIGGVIGLLLGAAILLLGLAVIVVAIGLVEWWVGRQA